MASSPASAGKLFFDLLHSPLVWVKISTRMTGGQSTENRRGQLILVEGLDRTGKSTQVARLSQLVAGSKTLKFPERSTKIGGIINEYLTNDDFQLPDQAIHLLFSANRWELYQLIIDDLNSGITIILDRYVYSGIAYSLSKNLDNEMSSVDWLLSPDKGLPKPDITLFLTLDMDEIKSRSSFGVERYEKLEFQETVKANFFKILDQNDPSIKVVDVNKKSIEQVTQALWAIIEAGKHGELTSRPLLFL